jgi:UDP-glucose 4-epimerase
MNGGSTAVIGAGGFIGTNLRRAMLAAGIRVRALSRTWLAPPEDALELALTTDTDDREMVAALIAGCDCVVVLSNDLLPGSSIGHAGQGMLRSLSANLYLIELCAENNVRLIYLSSGGTVYGPDAIVPTPEDTPCNPISMYGVTKLTTEKILGVYGRQRGLEYRVLRVSNPYGPWQLGRNGQGVIGAWLRQALAGKQIEVWGDGTVVRDYIYIDDVVAAIIAATRHSGSSRVFNIGSGKGESLQQILGIVQAVCAVGVRYSGARAIDVPVSILDIRRAERELDWRPATSLDNGIQLTLQWISERLIHADE